MKKHLFTTLLLAFSLTAALCAEQKYSAEDFLNIVRHGHPEKTWAIHSGTIDTLKRGQDSVSIKVRFDVRFTVDRMLGKLVLDNNETFIIGQAYDGTPASLVKPDGKDASLSALTQVGLKPDDLTMAFIYWKLNKELDSEKIKSLDCRVFELENTKKGSNEFVKVYISSKYFMPIKAEFFDNSKLDKPTRTILIDDFKNEGNLWTVSAFTIKGPGWRTKVSFDSIKLGEVAKDGVPPELFK